MAKNPFLNNARSSKDVEFWVREMRQQREEEGKPVKGAFVILFVESTAPTGGKPSGKLVTTAAAMFSDKDVPLTTPEVVAAMEYEKFLMQKMRLEGARKQPPKKK